MLPGAKDDDRSLARALESVPPRRRAGRGSSTGSGRSPSHLPRPGDPTKRQAGGVPLTDDENLTPPRHRASFCSRFGAPAQYERA